MKGLRKSALEDSSPMGLVLTVAVTSTENRKNHCLGRDSRSAVTSIL